MESEEEGKEDVHSILDSPNGPSYWLRDSLLHHTSAEAKTKAMRILFATDKVRIRSRKEGSETLYWVITKKEEKQLVKCLCGMRDLPGWHTMNACIPQGGHQWASEEQYGRVRTSDSDSEEIPHHFEYVMQDKINQREEETIVTMEPDNRMGGGNVVGSPTPPPETQTQTGDATPEPAPVTTYYISPTPPLTPHLTADQFGRSVHSELSQWFSFAIAILALTGCLMTIALMANKPVKGI